MDRLPDELIREIVLPGICISDKAFSADLDTEMRRRRVGIWHREPTEISTNPITSSSTILLVCKRWLRITTPLLYEVVVLRSTGQANALDRVLRGKNKSFGLFVKKLRVEGGFGAVMGRILKLTPNITHLYLSLEIWTPDTASGLCASLPLLNPTNVILHDDAYSSKNVTTRALTEVVSTCLTEHWTNMKVFRFPEVSDHAAKTAHWLACLPQCPSLEEVDLHPIVRDKDLVSKLAELPRLKVIDVDRAATDISEVDDPNHFIYRWMCNRLWDLDKHIAKTPKLLSLIRYKEAEPMETESVSDFEEGEREEMPQVSFNSTMLDVPASVSDAIWSRIMMFVSLASRTNVPLHTLQLVSKTFHRLTTPWLYHHPILFRERMMELFVDRLREDPSLGTLIQGYTLACGATDWSPALPDIFSLAPSVRWCRGQGYPSTLLPWDTFLSIIQTSSHSLIEWTGPRIHVPASRLASFSILYPLRNLRILRWECEAEFSSPQAHDVADFFPALEELSLAKATSSSFIGILARATLPALRTVNFWGTFGSALLPFLLAHGTKITHLRLDTYNDYIFQYCTSLEELSLPNDDYVEYATSLFTHKPSPSLQSLRKITLRMNGYFTAKQLGKEWKQVFANFAFESFPALHEVQLATRSSMWPLIIHREILKSPWPKWSERLEEHGIRLTDGNGVGRKRRV